MFALRTVNTSRKRFPCSLCKRSLDDSACFDRGQGGKSSPNSHDFALGRGSSARFILYRFMAARTLCRLRIDS